MKKAILTGFILVSAIFSFSLLLAQTNETMTVTTYYPSPYGSYRDLTTYQLRIGSDVAYANANEVANNFQNGMIIEGNVGIGTNAPQAALDITSTDSGMLPPRMSTGQRNAMAAPIEGMIIYNATTQQTEQYSGGAWKSMGLAPTGLYGLCVQDLSGFGATVTMPPMDASCNCVPAGEYTKVLISQDLSVGGYGIPPGGSARYSCYKL